MPALLATWNPARDAWETSHSHIDLFSALSAVFSETWPSWGMTRGGVAYELPTSAPLTDGSASSSSPGLLVPTPLHSDAGPRGGTTGFGLRDWSRDLLPTPKATDAKIPSAGDLNRNEPGLRAIDGLLLRTPTAQLAVNGGSQHPDKRKAGGHGPTLADEVEHLLPTPKATDGTKGGPNQRGSSGAAVRPSLDTLAPMLLPTPTSSDGERTSTTYERGNPTLIGALLPTPTAMDSIGSRNCTAQRGPDAKPSSNGTTLTDWLWLHEGWTGDLTEPPSDDGNAA